MPIDFFLSYATLDDKPALPDEEKSRWVTTFRKALLGNLPAHLNREPTYFFDDQDLHGNDPLTPEIQQNLKDAHLFVAISSDTYYTRPWCRLERRSFLDKLGVNPALARRVLVVHLDRVDQAAWQAEFFPDVRGYEFYREESKGIYRPLGKPYLGLDPVDTKAYYDAIDLLARDMANRIRELEQEAAGQPRSSRGVVFLAENSALARTPREDLRVALEEAQYDVRSASALVGLTEEKRAAAQAGALAFVQVVSTAPMETPGTPGTTYDQVQFAGAQGLPLFRWRAPQLDFKPLDAAYPGYEQFALAADVREDLFPKFKEELLSGLKALSAKKQVAAAAQGDDRLVLVTGDPDDLDQHSQGVGAALRQRQLGHLITKEPAEELAADDVYGFLVVYGGTPAEFVSDRLRIYRRLPKPRQALLRGRVGVYFTAPPPPLARRELLYDLPWFHKIHWDDPSSLDKFAQAVNA